MPKAEGPTHDQEVTGLNPAIGKVLQWRSQKAEKVRLIEGKLLYQVMIFYNYVPFQNGNFSLRKEFAPRGSKRFPLRAVP